MSETVGSLTEIDLFATFNQWRIKDNLLIIQNNLLANTTGIPRVTSDSLFVNQDSHHGGYIFVDGLHTAADNVADAFIEVEDNALALAIALG
jgi:hypothetical protein